MNVVPATGVPELAASINSFGVVARLPSFTCKATCRLMTDASRSQGPLPDCGSEKSHHLILIPLFWLIHKAALIFGIAAMISFP